MKDEKVPKQVSAYFAALARRANAKMVRGSEEAKARTLKAREARPPRGRQPALPVRDSGPAANRRPPESFGLPRSLGGSQHYSIMYFELPIIGAKWSCMNNPASNEESSKPSKSIKQSHRVEAQLAQRKKAKSDAETVTVPGPEMETTPVSTLPPVERLHLVKAETAERVEIVPEL